jgi:hypothetical protein
MPKNGENGYLRNETRLISGISQVIGRKPWTLYISLKHQILICRRIIINIDRSTELVADSRLRTSALWVGEKAGIDRPGVDERGTLTTLR